MPFVLPKIITRLKIKHLVLLPILSCYCFLALIPVCRSDVSEVLAERNRILAEEDKRFLGGSLTLNAMEKTANGVLMNVKEEEYIRSFFSADFPPANHFFQSKQAMLQSQVYQFIRNMPKGLISYISNEAFVVYFSLTVV